MMQNLRSKYFIIGWLLGFFMVSNQMSVAMTASEAIALLELRRSAIQDYHLVVSQSFYRPAYSYDKAAEMAEKAGRGTVESMISGGFANRDDILEKVEGIKHGILFSRSRSVWDGNIATVKGISTRSYLYSIVSIWPTFEPQLIDFFLSPAFLSESVGSGSTDMSFRHDHYFFLSHLLLRTPELEFNVEVGVDRNVVSDESMPPGRNLYQPTRAVEANVGIHHTQNDSGVKRNFIFPFEHERIIDMANDNAKIEIHETTAGHFLLSVQPEGRPSIFEATLNSKGDVLEYMVKHIRDSGEEWVEFQITYDLYVTIEPGGIRIPMLGIQYVTEREPTSEHALPIRERIEVKNVVLALVNVGYTLDDLSVTLPAGSAITDRRTDSAQRIEFDEDKEITAAQLVSGVIE